jgi:RNA polymerase sigma factor (sigma-70 family)
LVELVDFLNDHGGSLYGLLYRLTLRADVSEDLMQELFLKLNPSNGFHSAMNPLAYARRTAMNLAFDWRRNRNKLSDSQLRNDEVTDEAPTPLERLVEIERIQVVLDAMVGLSPSNCELLIMHFIGQEPYETLAAELGKTPHQIRGLCHKALAQLRELLTEASREDNRQGTS